jgi:dolichol-phosphate mannosyltransferase
MPIRFMKFGIVGGLGVIVNLFSMTLIIHLIGWQNWRASALATFIATINNYILNNVWTFKDRILTGTEFFLGILYYSFFSLASVLIITGLYSSITTITGGLQGISSIIGKSPVTYKLFCQFIAIMPVAYFNYYMNIKITWRAKSNFHIEKI